MTNSILITRVAFLHHTERVATAERRAALLRGDRGPDTFRPPRRLQRLRLRLA